MKLEDVGMSMGAKYQKWIKSRVAKPLGRCKEVTLAMISEFPELNRVRGFYDCCIWGRREHWWLVDPNNEIIDPTVDQFPSKGISPYVPWDESKEEPTGRCLYCGDYAYRNRNCCGFDCFEKLDKIYNVPRKRKTVQENE
jgi:hypothetical protein